MKDPIKFLIESSKLKQTTRTGWIIWRIKNPETIAEHTFRVAFLAYLLSAKKKINVKNAIQDALVHDLCEVYAGDATPFFYYQNLDIRNKKDRQILLKGVRLFGKEKEKNSKLKFEKEKRSLIKLVSFLDDGPQNEILLRWLDYEHGLSPAGKFAKQIDWIENLIQSLEYLGPKKSGSGWWEIAEEKVWDPLLLEFLHIIQNRFYNKKFPRDKELENILDFALEIEKLKRMPRTYWTLRQVKNPETVAGHIFTLALMVLIFGAKKKQLNMEKLLKMTLCHEIVAIYTGDIVPYYADLPKDNRRRKKVLASLPRQFGEEKIRKFSSDYKLELNAIKKSVSNFRPAFKKEIIQLWQEYRNRSGPEGRFLSQLNVLAVLFQGLLYKRENNKFSIQAIWEWAFEICDDELCIDLMEKMKKEFQKPQG